MARPPFRNEPHTDFTRAEARERMRTRLRRGGGAGAYYPLLIGEKEVRTGDGSASLNPANPSEVVGVVAQAGVKEADAAIAEAKSAFPQWSRTDAGRARGDLGARRGLDLPRRASISRRSRYSKSGKTWEEADADVAEAIDFCRYYASEMRRIASTTYPVPGELNIHHYSARGIAAIIAPWNFPLAILCGMTAAALVAGNCAIMKPSEQSAVIGARLARIFARRACRPGPSSYLSGPGPSWALTWWSIRRWR